MEHRQLGNTGMNTSVLGFGGAEIGFEGIRPEKVRDILNNALDSGLNVIDTAECYANSEELIGTAVSNRRKEYFLFTKCGHPLGRFGEEDWRPESLLKSIERSLKRLRTDYVDLVHLHSCSLEELQKGEVISALQEARDKGYTRFIGYSGDDQAARYAVECNQFDTLQTSINIADQQALELTLPLARDKGMGVIAKRPLANAAWKTGKLPHNPYHHVYWERLQALDYDFLQGNLKDSINIALRFTLGIPGVHTAIVGTTKPERWAENAAMVAAGPLNSERQEAILSRWKQVSAKDWIGQV